MSGPSKQRFGELYEKGQRVQGMFCRVLFLPGEGHTGFATTKSIGNRPKRNRVRRRFQAGVAPECIPTGLDVVIQIKASGALASFEEIKADLDSVLTKVQERWAEQSASSS